MTDNLDIPKDQVDIIFETVLFPYISKNVEGESNKKAYIVGGQPGSGKSSFVSDLMQENKNLVFINGDDLRPYHPDYVSYLEQDDQNAADKTQPVCNYWIEKAIEKCIESGYSFIVEGTMRTHVAPLSTAEKARKALYEVFGCIIATPYDLSLASINYRYEETKRIEGKARFTKKESHDEAYNNISNTIQKLLNSNIFHEFLIYKRSDGSFEKFVFSPVQKEGIIRTFTEGRERLFTDKEMDFIGRNLVKAEANVELEKLS